MPEQIHHEPSKLRKLWWQKRRYFEKWRMNPRLEFKIWKDSWYLRSLAGIHRGKRGFVIGNGPSLKIADLDKIKNEITIASNKVYLAFTKTPWRPSYFTIVDGLVWDKTYHEVNAHGLTPIVRATLADHSATHTRVRELGCTTGTYRNSGRLPFSSDFSAGSFGGYTVTYDNLQLAVHLGLDPIYVIGCDHYYTDEPTSSAKLISNPIANKTNKNHFLPSYRQVGEVVNPAPINEMTISYEIAALYAKENGIGIWNATRGGHLEAFPRCSFDELFANRCATAENTRS